MKDDVELEGVLTQEELLDQALSAAEREGRVVLVDAVIPGGIAEMFLSTPKEERVFLKSVTSSFPSYI